jgi:D-apionolactonase
MSGRIRAWYIHLSVLSRNVLYYGKEEPLPEAIPLRAGPLSLLFQAGDLRYVRLGDQEILRRVYVAVRNRNWGTVPAALTNVAVESSSSGFRIAFDAEHKQDEIHFRWHATLTGGSDGTITFKMEGQALSTFFKNRIGFCVLHPTQTCEGRPCRVEHSGGSTENGTFPKLVSPQQPFLDIRAISHEVLPGVRAEVAFAGDVFEMEDQRNWTDATYKIYSTPLTKPFPVEVRQDTAITQTIELRLQGRTPEAPAAASPGAVTVSAAKAPVVPLPLIGLGMASDGSSLSPVDVARLKRLHLAHLRVDLHLRQPESAARLKQALADAQNLNVGLEAAVHLSDAAEQELRQLAAQLRAAEPRVSRWLIFQEKEKSTGDQWVRLARKYLKPMRPSAAIVTGTNAYLAELNRGRPDPAVADAVCFSLNPQVHAFDNDSLAENAAAQADAVESARRFCTARRVVVSPVTLKPRFNPNATAAELPAPGQLPSEVDPRQMSLFGAAWTLGSLKYLAESGAASVTYYETKGWRGVLASADTAQLPEPFRSLPGVVFPLYHVLALIGDFSGGDAVPVTSSSPLAADGLLLRAGKHRRAILANWGAKPLTVSLAGLGLGGTVRLKRLHEGNVENAMREPESFRTQAGESMTLKQDRAEISLGPYAIAWVDSPG